MIKKAITSFLILIVILLTLSTALTYYLNRAFDTEKVYAANKHDLVNINDIIKNVQSSLEDESLKSLQDALEQSTYDLTLYDLDGKILFDSKNKENIGKSFDINKVLSESNVDKQIYTVAYHREEKPEYTLAVIDTHENIPAIYNLEHKVAIFVWSISIFSVLTLFFAFALIYFKVLHPFKKLERFAGEVAKGNLEVPLVLERHNLFGAFTWAFDMLRNELKSSREREQEAERTKKELVAALSHDLRTPVASIKAYSECLKSLSDKNSERAERYIEVIIKKADEVTKLSQDMFLHAISDLEKLEILPEEYQSRELLNSLIEPLIIHYENRIFIDNAFPNVQIFTDKARLSQVFENIISNAVKYAPHSDIKVESSISDGMLKCCFKDYGNGVLPEDIPFLFDKFYRGKNAKESGQPGSGLGLYISKYILEKIGGQIRAFNYSEYGKTGFAVEISLMIV